MKPKQVQTTIILNKSDAIIFEKWFREYTFCHSRVVDVGQVGVDEQYIKFVLDEGELSYVQGVAFGLVLKNK